MLLRILKDLKAYWGVCVIVVVPLLLLPLPVCYGGKVANCAFVVLLMAIYWMTEVLPLPVTSFFPIFLFPMMGVMSSSETCAEYLKDGNFLFFGGLVMAVAVEESNLHKRIALKVLLNMGSKPAWLMFGFMSTTAFLSMWMSNTATTAMVLPIAIAVLEELMHFKYSSVNSKHKITAESKPENIDERDNEISLAMVESGRPADSQPAVPIATSNSKPTLAAIMKVASTEDLKLCKGLLLSICYSANIGGTATLTGTGPNVVLSGQLQSLYDNKQDDVTFASWMVFAVPQMIVMLFISWLWLQFWFFGWRNMVWFTCKKSNPSNQKDPVEILLRGKYDELGKIKFAELSVLFFFIILVFLWIFREPKFVSGWGSLFSSGFTTDSTCVMLIICILFFWPSEMPDFLCFRQTKDSKPQIRKPILTWTSMKKFPWDVVMLLGGGFAMAKGVQVFMVSDTLGDQLQELHTVPHWAFVIITLTFTTFLTEFSSNVATASIFIPLMASLAQAIHANPLYFMLPVTISASFAFMLPVSTPPNAIVFGAGVLRVVDMITVGFCMNIICITVSSISMNTFVYKLFSFDTYPDWAPSYNDSATSAVVTSTSTMTAI